ncbi:MAG: nuclear transport factor 2 family protein, partial [Melioribacteraceae bacterium]|nr:nuclear transport factor 2 family protein [Melioribacteraceae bacterium]
MDKSKEILLEETYNKFINMALSNSSLAGWDDIIDPKVMAYGTALDEKYFTIKETRELIERQQEQQKTFDHFDFKMKPVFNSLLNNGNSAIIISEIDLTIGVNGEKNILPLRLSTVLEYKNDNWKVIHWHGSIAEHVAGDDDTWHIDEWKKKSEELERLVEEKTNDLLIKNRELEIEASLERIRTTAMSMQKSEELLDVVEIFNRELNSLGIPDIRNTNINIFDDVKETFLNYEYSEYDGRMLNEVHYNSHPSNSQYVNRMRENPKEYMITEFTGNDLEEWKKWRIKEGQKPDMKLDQAESLYYYDYSIGSGSIGISSFKPIGEDHLEILKKIRNVFELAYRRYSDIVEAEEHAREAKIEASLERVRTKTMAMQKSSDLAETSFLLAQQVRELGIKAWGCAFHIYADNEEGDYEWFSNEDGYLPTYKTPRKKFFLRFYEKSKGSEKLYIEKFKGEECAAH